MAKTTQGKTIMANEEQLKVLKQGVEVWNQWRKEHPDKKVNLKGVILSRANLRKADLNRADLREADLNRAELREADLEEAILRNADLHKANLHRANLHRANLTKADLTEANLEGANLRGVRLIKTRLNRATLTGANLYGSARDDWQIDGIQCDYIYWDEKPLFRQRSEEEKREEEQWLAAHRNPKDRNFRPGEFEELYKSLPTIEYYFEYGFTPIEAVVMDKVVQAINNRHPEFELRLDSFHSRGQPHAVFTVLHKEHAEDALGQITAGYETKIKVLEGQQETLKEVIGMLASGGVNITAARDVIIQQAQQNAIVGRTEEDANEESERELSPEEQQIQELKRRIRDTVPGSLEEQEIRKQIDVLKIEMQEI